MFPKFPKWSIRPGSWALPGVHKGWTHTTESGSFTGGGVADLFPPGYSAGIGQKEAPTSCDFQRPRNDIWTSECRWTMAGLLLLAGAVLGAFSINVSEPRHALSFVAATRYITVFSQENTTLILHLVADRRAALYFSFARRRPRLTVSDYYTTLVSHQTSVFPPGQTWK